jgi:anti-sigma factor RsiW
LVAYQLGAISDPERLEVEAHLSECGECLGGFFALKRRVDLAADPEARPSAQTRVRLRASVARALVRPRRLPLRLLAAGAAVAAALTWLSWIQRHNPAHSRLALPLANTLIDTGSAALVARVQ